jgi:uncharacterized protein (UPF0147 family)
MDVTTLSSLAPWEWPAEAAAVLLSALRSDRRDDPARRLAVELASSTTVMNDALAEALLAILRDPGEAEPVRAAAAISLGPTLEEIGLNWDEFDDLEPPLVSEGVASAIRRCLQEVYEDAGGSKEVRRRALEASVRIEEDWHAAAVRAAYDSGDDDWRVTAVFSMGYVAGFDREIVDALETGDPRVHCEAVRAAGTWSLPAAWPHIRPLLAETVDKPLLLAAIEAAGSIRPAEARDLLVDLALSDDEEIAEAVADALAMVSGEG